jgi:hypothetical protein
MKTIVITGDSWGAGEWGIKTDPPLIHGGLSDYFAQDGYCVINLSHPGKGPLTYLVELHKFLMVNRNKIEHIFFIQSCIGRDFTTRFDEHLAFLKRLPGHHHLVWNDNLNLESNIVGCYKQIYDKLNFMATYHRTVINVIGGLTDLLPPFPEFSNLNFLIPSWVSLIDSSMSKCILIDKLTFGYLDVVWKNKNKQEILSYIDSATERRSYMFNNKEFFWPDGMHPNRKGHKVLYDAIKSKLNL